MLALREESPVEDNNVARLDSRVARLESHVEHIVTDIAGIKTDQRDLRMAMEARFEKVEGKLDAMNEKFDSKLNSLNEKVDRNFVDITKSIGDLKVWVLGTIGTGLLAVLARALHWL